MKILSTSNFLGSRSSLGPRGQRPGEHRAISAGHSAEKDPKEVDQVDQVDHVSICFNMFHRFDA